MKLSSAASITVIVAAVMGGLTAVGSYAMGELDKKVSTVDLNMLIDTFEKARIKRDAAFDKRRLEDKTAAKKLLVKQYKREQRGYSMKLIKDPIDVWRIGALQDHIEELEGELESMQ